MFSGKGGWIPNSAPQFISLSIIWHHRIHTPQPLGQVSIPEAGTLWRQTPSWSLTKSRILKRASQHFRVLKGCNLQEVFQSNPLCITIYYISAYPSIQSSPLHVVDAGCRVPPTSVKATKVTSTFAASAKGFAKNCPNLSWQDSDKVNLCCLGLGINLHHWIIWIYTFQNTFKTKTNLYRLTVKPSELISCCHLRKRNVWTCDHLTTPAKRHPYEGIQSSLGKTSLNRKMHILSTRANLLSWSVVMGNWHDKFWDPKLEIRSLYWPLALPFSIKWPCWPC